VAHRRRCATTPTKPKPKTKTKRRSETQPRATATVGHASSADHGGPARATVTSSSGASTPVTTLTSSITTTDGSGTDVQTAADQAISQLSTLAIDDSNPPKRLVPIYKAAARRYGVPWTVLAAINAIETDYGRDTQVSSAGAIGWMQFMPATWRKYGVDADGTGAADPDNARDAIFAAARLLAANGGSKHLRRAVFAYNHAGWYVTEVLWLSERIAGTHPGARASVKLSAMRTAAAALEGLPYVYGGGHGGWTLSAGYDCSGFVSAVLHAAGYLTEPVTTQTLPSQPGIVSGPGRWVTIFDRTDAASTTEDHVIIELDGQWWESGGSSTDGGGADVHRLATISPSYLETFNLVLHPRSL
jgi:cell wall-associated NlpC family hydrolase